MTGADLRPGRERACLSTIATSFIALVLGIIALAIQRSA
jgi:hypothetical protein